MTRCLILMHSVGGGAEKVTLELAQRLDPRHFEVVLCSTRHLPGLASQIPANMPFYMPTRPGFAAALRNFFHIRALARKSDVVLGSLELQSIFWAALLASGWAVAWLHKDVGGYLAQRGRGYALLYRHLLGWALCRCRDVACVSQGILESSARLWPDLCPRLRILWNPVDTEAICRRARAPLPTALHGCFRKPVILGVGRLEAQKAFHILIEAHALLRRRGLDYNLCIVGEGAQRAHLEAVVRSRGVSDSVFLPGFLDPYPLMARAEVLAVSSLFEGMPLNITEALCLGLAVVAVDCPSGPREVLDGGRYGTLTPVGDVAALADALQARLLRPADAAAVEAGKRRAEDFAPEITVGVWAQLLAAQAKCNNK